MDGWTDGQTSQPCIFLPQAPTPSNDPNNCVFLCANQTESPISLAQDPNVSHVWAWLTIVHKMHEQINEGVYEQPLLALFQPGYSVCNRSPREASK